MKTEQPISQDVNPRTFSIEWTLWLSLGSLNKVRLETAVAADSPAIHASTRVIPVTLPMP